MAGAIERALPVIVPAQPHPEYVLVGDRHVKLTRSLLNMTLPDFQRLVYDLGLGALGVSLRPADPPNLRNGTCLR